MNIDSKQICMALTVMMLLAGCLQIPGDHLALGSRSASVFPISAPDRCTADLMVQPTSVEVFHGATLNADGFILVNWNLFKESKPGWDTDLKSLVAQAEIVLLQEARISDKLTSIMEYQGIIWDLATAFIYNGKPAGVLTASEARPLMRCMVRTPEPLLRVPKSMLITRYALSGNSSSLVVVNLHCVNFEWGTAGYRRVWQEVLNILAPHAGPLIVAGDFNTWSPARMRIVEEGMDRLGLVPVAFQNDTRSMFWGYAVDHIYYRGLRQLEARVLPLESSDHHPMMVKFKLCDSS